MTKALRRRVVSKRPDPEPCRDQDLGKFEVTARDGAARLGKLFTRHGILETPMLLLQSTQIFALLNPGRCGISIE